MLDPFAKARRFFEVAKENVSLAEATTDVRMRNHYCRLADHYLKMANAELNSAAPNRDRSMVDGS